MDAVGEWHVRNRSSVHISTSGVIAEACRSNGEFRITSGLYSVGTVVYLVLW